MKLGRQLVAGCHRLWLYCFKGRGKRPKGRRAATPSKFWILFFQLDTEAWFQRTINRKWPMASRMVTWAMISPDAERSRSWPNMFKVPVQSAPRKNVNNQIHWNNTSCTKLVCIRLSEGRTVFVWRAQSWDCACSFCWLCPSYCLMHCAVGLGLSVLACRLPILARNVIQHICLAHYMLSPVRLSVCPSVTRVDRTKMVEDRFVKFSPYDSPIALVFEG